MARSQIGHVISCIVIGLCFLICTSWTTPCRAADKAQAKDKFMEGMSYIQQENYLSALQAFESSYQIFPKVSVLFNIGMCQKALYRYVDAMGTFKKFLAEAGDDVKPELKRDARTTLKQLDELVGRLRLQDVPPDARVRVNGKDVGVAPLEGPILLDPATYNLEVVREGYEPLRIKVTVTLGTMIKVPASLVPVGEGREMPMEETPSPKKREKLSPMMISGIVLGAVGVAGVGVGAYFTVRYNNHFDDLETAQENAENATTTDEQDLYEAEYDDIKNNKLPKDQAGMIAGYVAGGALVLTGVALIVADVVKKNKKESQSAVTVLPSPGGVTVLF